MSLKKDALIIIPAYRRPEMLAVTLEYIAKADGADRNLYLFSLDEGFDPETIKIIQTFPLGHSARINERKGSGNSSNILSAYRAAYISAKKLKIPVVGLIEEDIWVAKDYFTFHNQIHKQLVTDQHPPKAPWYAVSACRNQNLDRQFAEYPNRFYRHGSYQSLGVSFRTEMLIALFMHDNEQYYRAPKLYIESLRNRRLSSNFTEQDGLIDAVMYSNGWKCIYPYAPRAFHAGYWGYGGRRGNPPKGTLEERIEAIKAMGENEMNTNTDWKDIKFCNLEGYGAIQEFYENPAAAH